MIHAAIACNNASITNGIRITHLAQNKARAINRVAHLTLLAPVIQPRKRVLRRPRPPRPPSPSLLLLRVLRVLLWVRLVRLRVSVQLLLLLLLLLLLRMRMIRMQIMLVVGGRVGSKRDGVDKL